MTRDEAIKTFRGYMSFAADTDVDVQTRMDQGAENSVDVFVALGMLKLDEPMTARELARGAIEREIVAWNMLRAGNAKTQDVSFSMLAAFDRAGLKIVEK